MTLEELLLFYDQDKDFNEELKKKNEELNKKNEELKEEINKLKFINKLLKNYINEVDS